MILAVPPESEISLAMNARGNRLRRVIFLLWIIVLPAWILSSPCLAAGAGFEQSTSATSSVRPTWTGPTSPLGSHVPRKKIGLRIHLQRRINNVLITPHHRRRRQFGLETPSVRIHAFIIQVANLNDLNEHLPPSTHLRRSERSPPSPLSL
jgi:hypothetical protein